MMLVKFVYHARPFWKAGALKKPAKTTSESAAAAVAAVIAAAVAAATGVVAAAIGVAAAAIVPATEIEIETATDEINNYGLVQFFAQTAVG